MCLTGENPGHSETPGRCIERKVQRAVYKWLQGHAVDPFVRGFNKHGKDARCHGSSVQLCGRPGQQNGCKAETVAKRCKEPVGDVVRTQKTNPQPRRPESYGTLITVRAK